MDTQYGGQNKMSNSGLNMSRRIRRTPYTEKVIEAGVSGFTVVNHMLLPKSYKATVEEDYWHLSKNTQIWDVSCQRQVQIIGEDATKLIQLMSPRSIKDMPIGKCYYYPMIDENAGMINDPVLLKLSENKYWLSVADSDVLLWAKGLAVGRNFKVDIIEPDIYPLAIQGPKAIEAMQPLCNINLKDLGNFFHKNSRFAGFDNILVAKTGYTGSGGIEIYFDIRYAEKIWDKIMIAGSSFGISPIGLAARDTLRLEMGYYLYGQEINETTSPISAGLEWITKTETEFINYESHQKSIECGTDSKLIAFEMDARGIPRSGYCIFDEKEKLIGKVTSGTQSPLLNKGIGMGYVKSNFSANGNKLYIGIREKFNPCTVVKPPFYKIKKDKN